MGMFVCDVCGSVCLRMSVSEEAQPGMQAGIDMMGVVTSVGQLGSVKRKSDNSELSRRDVTLLDQRYSLKWKRKQMKRKGGERKDCAFLASTYCKSQSLYQEGCKG